MSATLTEPTEAYELREATSVSLFGASTIPDEVRSRYSDEDLAALVPMHIIRPGIGRGKGRHLYEAKMLEENAHKFRGWKMYVDHQSEQAKKAQGGLPRTMRDAGGVLKESWWDPSIPANPAKGHGPGAVVGLAKPTRMVRELIEDVPEFVEASIAARATGVRRVTAGGTQAWLVEGIEDRGTVDWVTEAGAGGRVVALMEAAVEEEMAVLEALTDDEFVEYLRDERPHLLEAVKDSADPDPEGGDETMGDITPEMLAEAVQTDEFKSTLDTLVTEQVESKLPDLVEAAVSQERELIRAEARADADRQIELRDLRDEARKMVVEAKLPSLFAGQVEAQFDLTDAGPTPKLNVIDDVSDDGEVTKSARAKLREAVESEIAAQRDLLAEANPTRVRNQGPKSAPEGESVKKGEGTYWGQVLQEAGVDPETAYSEA